MGVLRGARGAGTALAGLVLAALLAALVALSVRDGTTGTYPFATVARGALALAGLADPLGSPLQTIVELRLWRALTAAGVGASLALSGAYLQGLFRNALASPSVIGGTSGSVLGASLAIALVGGFGPTLVVERSGLLSPLFVTLCATLGALLVLGVVLLLAGRGGRVSAPTLLLAGMAINTVCAGLLAALQSFTLEDYEISRALLAWTFGTLDDRSGVQVLLVLLGLALATLLIPFVALELDLIGGGDEDAAALGVPVGRVRLLVLLAAALAAAVSVSVAGQIAFVGLMVPHAVRAFAGSAHRAVLPLSLLTGGVFLLGCDVLQRAVLPAVYLRPGVVMSLLGGPFFLFLLFRERKELVAW